MRSSGTLLCLGSGAAFGAMAVFGKLAYDDGATVGTLLAVRFALAAALFWALVLADGAARELRALRRRDIAIGLGPRRVRLRDPGRLLLRRAGAHRRLAAVAAALHLPGDRRRRRGRPRPRAGRRAPPRPRSALASGGLVLVLAGAGAGALDPLGAALGLGAAVVYSTYILVSEGDRRAPAAERALGARLHAARPSASRWARRCSATCARAS